MRMLNAHKSGMAVGGVLGLWHLVWSLLVAFKLAAPLMNWLYQLHSVRATYTVLPFNFLNSLYLVVIASLIGYAMGWTFATIWNMIKGKK